MLRLLALAAVLSLVPSTSALAASPTDVVAHRSMRVLAIGVTTPAGSTDACADRRYNLLGGEWNQTMRWRFQGSSTPDGMVQAATLLALKRSVNNITRSRNDCGRTDRVSATAAYSGGTTRRPGIDRDGFCTGFDGRNIVGFGRLPSGVVAVTCTWIQAGRIVEADIRLNTRHTFATSLAGCSGGDAMLESVMTHEFGHAFGLGHVSESAHPDLTMSRRLNGPCDLAEATLGIGDMLGLQALY